MTDNKILLTGLRQLTMIFATAFLFSLTSCLSGSIFPDDPIPPYPEPPPRGSDDTKTVSLRITQPEMGTRSVSERPVYDGELVRFNSGHLYLTTAEGVIVRHFVITERNGGAATTLVVDPVTGITTGGTINIVDLETGEDIGLVPGNVSRVVIVGNTPLVTRADGTTLLTHAGNIRNVVRGEDGFVRGAMGGRTIASQWNVWTPGVNLFVDAPLALAATQPSDPTVPRIWSVNAIVAPTVARFEIGQLTGLGLIESFEVSGIFIDRYFPQAHIDGSFPTGAALTARYTNTASFAAGAAGTNYILAHSATHPIAPSGTTTVRMGALFTDYSIPLPAAARTPNGVIARPYGTPIDGVYPVWSYQVFARYFRGATNVSSFVNAPPRIIIRLNNVMLQDGTPMGTQWLTVDDFRNIDNSRMLSETGIRASNVYRIRNVRFEEWELQPQPNMSPINVDVSVTLAEWGEEDLRPSGFRQPYPVSASVGCPPITHTFRLGAAENGNCTNPGVAMRYRWDRSFNGGTTWTTIQSESTDRDLTNTPITQNTYFRRVAICGCGQRYYTPWARITVPPLRNDIPDYVIIGIGANARRWSTRNLDTPGVFVAHSSFRGRFYQWGTIGGVTHHWDATTPGTGVAVGGWNSTNTRTAWTNAQEPCRMAPNHPPGSATWRLPVGGNNASDEFLMLLNASPLGSDSQRGQWITEAQAGLLGLGCTPGRLFGPLVNTVIVGGNVVPAAFDPSTMVFLPAAGWRNVATGVLFNPRSLGVYWSSTPNDTTSGSLIFNDGLASVGTSDRAFGFLVRCVSE